KGYHIYLRNSRNQIEQPYRGGAEDKEAIPGKDIVTTIDADLQQYGQQLMTVCVIVGVVGVANS
ncbi:MAG: hypothetical protein J6Y02_18945, partial [Pseudobutyrivibrio sp.]|nr:hypothetical protein [Pseudobutyrivibrio sp.]